MKYLASLFVLSLLAFPLMAQVHPLLQQARQALADGNFASAESLATKGLKQVSSKLSVEYRGLTDVLIESYIADNKLTEAEKTTRDCLSLLTEAYGKEDTALVSYQAALGSIHYLNGYYDDAIKEYEAALSVLQKKGLADQQTAAELQNNLGMLYSQTGELAKALQALNNSKAFFEKKGSDHTAELALLYNNLADVYHNKYDYNKADQYYRLSLKAFQTLNDESSPDYLNTLGNFSLLQLDRGKTDAALKGLLKNKQLAEAHAGKESAEYATVLNNLGQAYKKIGHYRLAEDYLTEAYQVKQKIYSQEHPSSMTAANNLAMFYYTIGQQQKAETMMSELMALHKQYHKDDWQQLLLYTNNLSAIYFAQNKIAKAQQTASDVVKLVEKTRGTTSIDYFQALNGYSVLLMEDETQLETAYSNYVRLSTLYAALKGQLPSEDIVAYHNNKGSAAMYTNRHAEATKEFQAGMKWVEEEYGKQHPDYYLFQSNYAYDLTLQGKPQEAAQPLLDAAQFRLNQVMELFPSLTESEKEFYIQTVQPDLTHYYVFCIKNYLQNPALTGEMANLRLRSKSLVMRSQNELRKNILSSGNPALVSEYEALNERKKELAKYRTLSKKDLNKLGVDLEKEIENIELQEKQFSKNTLSLGIRASHDNWKTVASKLKANEAAIEVIRVTDDHYEKSKVIFYAFLIFKNGQAHPELVVVENGKDLEKKQFNYYRNSVQNKIQNELSYKAYWSALAEKLNGIEKVYFSPDGIYHKINLNTIYHPETKKYLHEELKIELKGSLGQPIGALFNPSQEIFMVGHPNYYLDLKEALTNYAQGREPKARTVSSDVMEWNDLPGTKEEVGNIKTILQKEGWKVTAFTEEYAIENKVKNMKHPRLVHLATHGFFEETTTDTLSQYAAEYFIDPLLRSGLAFSGAGVDLAPHELESMQYFEDGILYANEALLLDLEGTDCVVLSACETGLGETRNQEGVYGLQRAFLIAGTQSVIMSLWSVDDQATKDLMTAFYSHYSKSKDLDGSFRSAVSEMLLKYKDPYYWGAFVLMKK